MSASQPAPRIAPIEPPYTPETAEFLRKWMPPNSPLEPLALFRTLAVHPELMNRMRPLGAGLLGHGTIAALEREIVIHRTCARTGAEYEWGVHAVAFGKPLGLTEAQLAATVIGDAGDPAWSPREALLIRLADELCDTATLSDALWAGLAEHWSPPQLIELIVLVGWYRLLAGVINGVGVVREKWGARFPGVPAR
jgi:4-carboxymuconolactone decarboxylase